MTMNNECTHHRYKDFINKMQRQTANNDNGHAQAWFFWNLNVQMVTFLNG
jgi:hypothetical protein